MRVLNAFFARLRRWQLAAVCLALIAIVGAADDHTAVVLTALYYLLPVSLGAWYGGRSLGLALAVVSTGTALFTTWPQVHAANLLGEIGLFVAGAMLVSQMKEERGPENASRQLVEGLLDAMPVRVFWKDKNLVYLGCNAAFARDAGFADPKNVVGKDDYQMAWRDQAERYRADDPRSSRAVGPSFSSRNPRPPPKGARSPS